MTYKDSLLYELSSKKVLAYYLKITDTHFFKQDFVATLVHPYIENKGGKKRLIEVPDDSLKSIQTRIKKILVKLEYPEYIFSGVKGRSYVDNARLHVGHNYLYKIDLTAFFPSIAREKVFNFYREKLRVSPDIAEVLTNFTSINLDKACIVSPKQVDDFLAMKGIKTRNHLISGSPASQLLSYLTNQDMFERLHCLSSSNGITMSVYVDDIMFSSTNHISTHFKDMVESIINSQHYRLSRKKAKAHTRYYPKKVTGTIINKQGELTISNSIRLKIINKCHQLKANPKDTQCRRELRGLVEAARQVIPNAYPSIYDLAYDPEYKLPRINRKRK